MHQQASAVSPFRVDVEVYQLFTSDKDSDDEDERKPAAKPSPPSPPRNPIDLTPAPIEAQPTVPFTPFDVASEVLKHARKDKRAPECWEEVKHKPHKWSIEITFNRDTMRVPPLMPPEHNVVSRSLLPHVRAQNFGTPSLVRLDRNWRRFDDENQRRDSLTFRGKQKREMNERQAADAETRFMPAPVLDIPPLPQLNQLVHQEIMTSAMQQSTNRQGAIRALQDIHEFLFTVQPETGALTHTHLAHGLEDQVHGCTHTFGDGPEPYLGWEHFLGTFALQHNTKAAWIEEELIRFIESRSQGRCSTSQRYREMDFEELLNLFRNIRRAGRGDELDMIAQSFISRYDGQWHPQHFLAEDPLPLDHLPTSNLRIGHDRATEENKREFNCISIKPQGHHEDIVLSASQILDCCDHEFFNIMQRLLLLNETSQEGHTERENESTVKVARRTSFKAGRMMMTITMEMMRTSISCYKHHQLSSTMESKAS